MIEGPDRGPEVTLDEVSRQLAEMRDIKGGSLREAQRLLDLEGKVSQLVARVAVIEALLGERAEEAERLKILSVL